MQHLDCQSVQLCLRQASGFPIDDNSRCRHSPFAQLSANEALNQLKEWEPLIEFWQILIGEIFTDRVNCSMELRWIAVIYCKNTVDRNWRRLKSQQNIDEAIIKPMKEGIRDTLVSATLQESTEKVILLWETKINVGNIIAITVGNPSVHSYRQDFENGFPAADYRTASHGGC